MPITDEKWCPVDIMVGQGSWTPPAAVQNKVLTHANSSNSLDWELGEVEHLRRFDHVTHHVVHLLYTTVMNLCWAHVASLFL